MNAPTSPSVLLVDDARDMLELLRRSMNAMGLTPFTANNVVDAIEVLEHGPVDLVITDLNMPEVSGIQLVRYMGEHFPHIPVLVITGYPKLEDAVQVMKLGAVEYIVKPFTQEELREAVERVLSSLAARTTEAPEPVEVRESFHGILGRSPAMQEVYRIIERTRNNRATVLVTGESGTGKEMVARAIHYNSAFAAAPFIAVNCGAIPDQLLESELFGHMKGAFTGATTSRAGFFQAADGGTLFLDEIGDMALAAQAKVLRALQEGRITPVGGDRDVQVNVRVIAATNKDLRKEIEKGNFREDLFHRLSVIPIHVPSLSERLEDIPLLADHFIQQVCSEQGIAPKKITDKAIKELQKLPWTGNVRELRNVIERLVILSGKEITEAEVKAYAVPRY